MDTEKISRAMERVKPGLNKYQRIQGLITKVNVSEDRDFQKSFNGFYRVRQRPVDFYQVFYSYMENAKNGSTSFETTLTHLYKELGRVEASFSSKLVATINPDMPVWDSVVLKNIGLKAPAYHRKNRIGESIEVYDQLINWYKDFLMTEKAKTIIEQFDATYPEAAITDIKKVDLVLWQIREQ